MKQDPDPAGSRRDFLKLATGAALTAATLPAARAQEADERGCLTASRDKRVGLATIGVGGQGTRDTKAALKLPGVELVAVADVYDGRLVRAREVFCPTLVTTRDYRELLARPDVDGEPQGEAADRVGSRGHARGRREEGLTRERPAGRAAGERSRQVCTVWRSLCGSRPRAS